MEEIFKKNEVFLPDIYFFTFLKPSFSFIFLPFLIIWAQLSSIILVKIFTQRFKIKGNGSHYQIIGSFLQSHIDRPIPTKVFPRTY